MAAGWHRRWRHPKPRDTELTAALDRARRGRETGFVSVYRQLHPGLLGYLTAQLGDDTAAAEAADAVWRTIAHEVFSFQGDGTDLRVWAASLAHRQVHDQHRRPGHAGVGAGGSADFRRVVSALPPDLADALLLRMVVGLDEAGAARVLGASAPSVEAAAHSAARLVADCLASGPAPGAPRTEWACAWC
ncbi:RNA polymerase sigma factor [Streptomyces regalis]|uniref:RNA polymerase sigma factor 70 region 4 type 2 domain-containing protein n=1 Tax=Streptomyces regalis TaxID=68262 RepID=A0A0X3VG52_9ACTN|nr:sigma factor-like helix-turn-helix DNA-binding protein [Streptomyces regalis]KUL43779.1 hypothetical protein ADL12_06835 [Streptomyces regalis]